MDGELRDELRDLRRILDHHIVIMEGRFERIEAQLAEIRRCVDFSESTQTFAPGTLGDVLVRADHEVFLARITDADPASRSITVEPCPKPSQP